MTKANDNVYPVVLQHGLTHDSHVEAGLTIRELFAAMAMQGTCSNYDIWSNTSAREIAGHAVEQADALIAELNKEVQS